MDRDYDLKDLPKATLRPELMVGAISPLWGYFGAAAMGGMAMWWMSRWVRPDNLEAMFDKLDGLTASAVETAQEALGETTQLVEAAGEAALETADEVISAQEEVLEEVEAVIEAAPEPQLPPIGGEAAPISPLVAVDLATDIAADAIAAVETTVEPIVEAVTETVAKRGKKGDPAVLDADEA